jgi:Tfp pilus assembly protein PilX
MPKNKNGVALITVMCFMMVLAILGTAFSMAVSSHVLRTSHEMNMERALVVAEAGAERGAAHIAAGGSTPHTFSGTLGDGIYHVSITAIDNVEDEGDGLLVTGSININPNNNSDNLFVLSLPNGTVIDRDDLQQDFGGYTGTATSIRVQPKGAGNQNSLIVDGEPFSLSNGTTYLIESESMTVNLYNDNVNSQGKALGKWYILVTATSATITEP